MHILIMGMNYFPEKTAIGPFTYQLSTYLVQQGHEVTVVTTFPHFPEWRIYDEYRGKIFMREKMDGVQVYRVPAYIPKNKKSISRIAYDTSFSFFALGAALLTKNIDVIMSVSPPLQIGLSAWVLGKIKRVPFLFQIQDIVPDAAVEVGVLKDTKVIKLALQLEKFVYKKAKAIGFISQGFGENLLNKGVPASKLHYLPNWINSEFIKPGARDNEFRHQHGIKKSDFLVMYAGNISTKQGLDVLINTAPLVRKDKHIKILIIGEGSMKDCLQQRAVEMNLDNLSFLGFQPREALPIMFSAADVLFISQKASITEMCLPSKCLYYMASGTPILAAVNKQSEIARLLNKAKCGVVVEPGTAGKLADAILILKESYELREELARNGRAFVKSNFEEAVLLKRIEELLSKISDK